MNVDRILDMLNRHEVEYLLIGGMNFFIRHRPVATFDVDVWIADTTLNRSRCEAALRDLDAAWGADEQAWGPVARLAPGWLERHGVYCLTSAAGDIDIFRSVKGLADWSDCARRASTSTTKSGVSFRGLSDRDMIACQEALPEGQRRVDRVLYLRKALHDDA